MYVKIRSWHIVGGWTPADLITGTASTAKTLCGRYSTAQPADSFGDEKTCETCLRVRAQRH